MAVVHMVNLETFTHCARGLSRYLKHSWWMEPTHSRKLNCKNPASLTDHIICELLTTTNIFNNGRVPWLIKYDFAFLLMRILAYLTYMTRGGTGCASSDTAALSVGATSGIIAPWCRHTRHPPYCKSWPLLVVTLLVLSSSRLLE